MNAAAMPACTQGSRRRWRKKNRSVATARREATPGYFSGTTSKAMEMRRSPDAKGMVAW